VIPTKPPKGAKCNGCGVCCIAETCPAGIELFGSDHQVCPALMFRDGRFNCGLMSEPEKFTTKEKVVEMLGFDPEEVVGKPVPGWMGRYFKTHIGCGVGCDSDDMEEK